MLELKTEKKENLSTITQALEQAHAIISKETGAPRAVIVIGRSSKVHGHFTFSKVWNNEGEEFHEIFLAASSFDRGARATLGTLIHEVAHSLNHQNGIKDISGDQYHNKDFKRTAEALGLEIGQVKGKGWTDTQVPDSCVTRWQAAYDLIEEALKLTARADTTGKKARNKNLKSVSCECGQKMRISAKSLEISAPFCQACETSFN